MILSSTMKPSKCNPHNLVWLDLEMTGLDPNLNYILEIATIVTDSALQILEEGPVFAISQPQAALEKMDDWNKKHHGQSGLIERVQKSTITLTVAEQKTIQFIQQYVAKHQSPLCGNSICTDRRFLIRYMPTLASYFHYRHLDVSTVKMLAHYWAPEIASKMHKTSTHLALQDIRDSIDELRYYRDHLFKVELPY